MTPERDRLLAEKARIEAELAKLDAGPEPDALALEEAENWLRKHDPRDGYRTLAGWIPRALAKYIMLTRPAAPLFPRDAGMADAEIEELAREYVCKFLGFSGWDDATDCRLTGKQDWERDQLYDLMKRAIRETLKRAPPVRWPGEARELLWRCHQLLERNIETKTRHDLEEQRLVVDLRAHLTGEGK